MDAFAVPEYVRLIGRADRQFWSWPWEHRNSDKTYEFLTRPESVKKGMAVWDNGPKPLLGANQKWGRVERWRGGLGAAYLFPALSSAGASLASPYSVSTLPLIEPDLRISRIRLSD